MNTKSLLTVLAEELAAWPETSPRHQCTFSDYFWCDMDGEIRHSLCIDNDFYPKSNVSVKNRGGKRYVKRSEWADARTLFLFRKSQKDIDVPAPTR